jgi:hypothetical protein
MFQRLVLREMGIDKNERQNLESETSGAAMGGRNSIYLMITVLLLSLEPEMVILRYRDI